MAAPIHHRQTRQGVPPESLVEKDQSKDEGPLDKLLQAQVFMEEVLS